MLRAFAVARQDSYVAMPGGLTRVAGVSGTCRAHGASGRSPRISNQAGAISKDTWVLASEPEKLSGFWLASGPPVAAVDPAASMSSRAAENLFWMGRYAERAEAMARLVRVVHDRRNDFQRARQPRRHRMPAGAAQALTRVSSTYPGFVGEGASDRLVLPGGRAVQPGGRRGPAGHPGPRRAPPARRRPGRARPTVGRHLDGGGHPRARDTGPAHVRPRSPDGRATHALGAGHAGPAGPFGPVWRGHGARPRLAVHGRRPAHRAGQQLVALLRATITVERSTATDSLLLESVLIAAESIITYRRRYRSHAQLETLLDLLLIDADNPRSLAYQLDQLAVDVRLIPRLDSGLRLSEPERLVLEASTALRLADTAVLAHAQEDGTRPAARQRPLPAPGVALPDRRRHRRGPLRPPPASALVARLMTYRVVHRTEYRYESEVSSSYGELYLLPRDVPGQVCRSSTVLIEPEPHDYRERSDFYGNRVAYFSVLEPHTRLAVTAESMVDVTRPASLPLAGRPALGDRARAPSTSTPATTPLTPAAFSLDSPKVVVSPAVARYAAVSFPAGRPLNEALTELTSRIHADFAYKPGATSVRTTLAELLERRKGVCQDFAHLAVGCLRSVGLPADT